MAELRLSRAGRRVLKVSEDVLRLLSEEARRAVERLDLSGDQRLAALLNDLYWRAGLSSSDIARLLGVDGRGLRRMMERLGVARRPRLEALKAKLTRFAKKPFDGDPVKRVRLHCLVAAEGHARRHHGQVEVTTSTPNPWLIQAFHELFRLYTEHFNMYGFRNLDTGYYEWRIGMLLDPSFMFLTGPLSLDLGDDEQFWSFIASMVEGESSIKFSSYEDGTARAYLEFYNEDHELIKLAARGLAMRGINARVFPAAKEGERRSLGRVSRTCLTVGVYDPLHASRVLEAIAPRLVHYEKYTYASLALRVLRRRPRWSELKLLLDPLKEVFESLIKYSKARAEEDAHRRAAAGLKRRRRRD